MTNEEHDPDSGFVARLEGELTAHYRRLARLGAPESRRRDLGHWLRGAGWAAAGLLLGAASLTMAQRLDGAETRELLERQAETASRVAAQRVEVHRRLLEPLRRDQAAGLINESMLAPARAALAEAETALALAELDAAEVTAAGRAVRTEIFAPPVGERDFVAERLRIELDAVAERTALLAPVIESAETRVSAGVAAPRTLSPLMAERERLAAAADRLRESLALRQRFLDGDVAAEEAELTQRLLLATARLRGAETELADLRAENERIRQRYEAGLSSTTELYTAQQPLLQAEADAELAQLEIDLLVRELDRIAQD
jgi:hypothetical protein